MKNLYTLFRTGAFAGLMSATISGAAQNLVVNPSAENGAPDGNGWTAVAGGSTCYGGSGWRMPGNQTGYPNATTGSYFFNPGCGGVTGNVYELRQDVNVSAYAGAVDANAYNVAFSGYLHSFAQSPADEAAITVEYRNATNTVVLGSHSTGYTTYTSGWTLYSRSQVVPSGTRFIRIRLLARSTNGNAIDAYFDDISLSGHSTLPVSLLDFTAAAQNGKVRLSWKTANETNNKGFQVLRSTDGTNWAEAGFVNAYTGSQANSYFFTDEPLSGGTVHYRLQQIDLNGKSTFSPVVTVKIEKTTSVVLYPNPASSQLFLKTTQNFRFAEIWDNAGRLVERKPFRNVINVGHLQPGVYVLKLDGENGAEYKQFSKQ